MESLTAVPAPLAAVPPPAPDAAPSSAVPTSLAGAAAALATACGGGGGDGPAPPPAPSPPPPSPPPPGIADAEAARFLAQASFAARDADISAVKSKGYAGWLEEQFAAPSSQGHFDWMVASGYATIDHRNDFGGVDNTLWRKLLSSPDQLRQRVVLALSEIFVISMAGLPVGWKGFAVAAYVDMLEQRAFGPFRDLLEGVTLSCGMGVYLAMRGNRKEDALTGRMPDENYAREVMQLFTIGLHELAADGTPVSGPDGKLRETYDLAAITELARVFTGWDFDGRSDSDPGFMRRPMTHLANRFSSGAKKVLDVDIPASADGPAALKIALDTLAGHPNVGPFIGRQLIQRLVCSNPSAAYVQRVAAAFADNGSGRRGDMKAVIKAVLLDAEARAPSTAPGGGKLREPLQRFIQWARLFGVTSPNGLWNVGDLSSAATRLGQSPLRSPSVFNFFRPGYVPPNSALGANGITAPEFQLCNESTVAGYLNFMQTVVANGIGELRPNYAAELALAADAPALVARVALLLAADGLSAATRSSIATAVGTIGGATDAGRRDRVHAAILMMLACPEYQVQK